MLILKLFIRKWVVFEQKNPQQHRLGSMLIFNIKKIMAILNVKY